MVNLVEEYTRVPCTILKLFRNKNFLKVVFVKISKGKPHQSGFGMQKGRLEGEAASLKVNHRPNRKTRHREESRITGPHRERRAPYLLQEVSTPAACRHPELPFFSSGLCFKTTLPTSSFLSIKPRSSPSCVGLACGLVIACMSQTAILCYSRINRFRGESN